MIITKTPFRMSFFDGGTDPEAVREYGNVDNIEHPAIRNAMKMLD